MKDEISELHIHAPIAREQYAFPDDGYRRLYGYAMHTGFATAAGSGSGKKGRIEYLRHSITLAELIPYIHRLI